MKGTQNSKPKVSKEFIDQLKNTQQIPAQKPKQVPVPLSNSQLPSPIISCNKNKRDQDIKEYPIEKICLDIGKPKLPTKNEKIPQNSLKQRKQNMNEEYEKAYPELLKPKGKEESSLVKKARDQNMSRSLIDMSIYHLLDDTSEKKVKHQKNDRLLYPKKQIQPKVNKSLEKIEPKKNGIKIVDNLRQKQPKQTKQPKKYNNSKQNLYMKENQYEKAYLGKLDPYYGYQQKGYDYYLDPYRGYSKENYVPNTQRQLYRGYSSSSMFNRKYDGRLGDLYGGYSSNLDRYGGYYGGRDYRSYLSYY